MAGRAVESRRRSRFAQVASSLTRPAGCAPWRAPLSIPPNIMQVQLELTMSITQMFARLGAPLVNHVWSWGAVSNDGQKVYLRVWQDEHRRLPDGRIAFRLTNHGFIAANPQYSSPGWPERLSHIQLIRNGAQGYCIMVIAVAIHAIPREIQSYIENAVFPITDLDRDAAGDEWAVLGPRQKV